MAAVSASQDTSADVPIVFSAPTLPFGELSNFYASSVTFCGVEYTTAEHAYQSQKFLGPGASDASRSAAELVRKQSTPFKAKLLAGLRPPRHYAWQQVLYTLAQELVQDGVALRADWEKVKVNVMLGVLRSKFRRDEACRAVLMQTGEQPLVERSASDTFWGQTADGVGQNVLGRLLVQVRRELRDEADSATAESGKEDA